MSTTAVLERFESTGEAADQPRALSDLVGEFLDGLSDLIIVHDVQGNVICATPSVTRFLGAAAHEVLTKSDVFGSVHPDDRAAVRWAFRSWAGGSRETAVVRFRARRFDGTWRDLVASGSSFLTDSGVLRVGMTARDPGVSARR